MAELQENESVQTLLKLLEENKMQGKAQDLSSLLFYVDGMERQFDAVVQELQAVKIQLADIKDSQNPIKKALTGMVQAIENKIEHAREQLHTIKDSIVENAAKMVEAVKQTGISALDKTVNFLGVRESLDAVREDLHQSISDTKQSIEKVETIGKELRSVGAHIKNVGRAVTGKEQQNVDGGTEGRFQAAVLTPLRTSHKLLSHMQNATLAAIGGMERLEQAADKGRDRAVEKKPSILQDLQAFKAQADSAKTAPAQEKQVKPQEAAI